MWWWVAGAEPEVDAAGAGAAPAPKMRDGDDGAAVEEEGAGWHAGDDPVLLAVVLMLVQ